ncbi:MAG TPA: UDP-N-acetylmuramoyl-tripeptide--D-alanyl-D-alanine ligase [Bacillota bacterium]|nr:UDP-N-acetylmuramoyl-tripeptide--D-alanyl-D-alanine ligase [Bacillota bacterium]
MAKFKIHQLITATGGVLLQGNPENSVSGITTDSRQIKPGELFLALRGEKFDGHDFIDTAIRNGATAIISAEAINLPEPIAVIQTPDTLDAYGAIARFHRERFPIPVIGITGSNGKTTTKDLTAAVLFQKFTTVRTEANFNNEIGLPATLLNITPETEVAIVEMGMRGLGQIRKLTEIARPNMAIITNVGLTHLELLGSQKNIAKAKAELVEALPADGVAILNGDDEYVRGMSSVTRARTVFFGLDHPDLDYRAEILAMDENGSRFQVITSARARMRSPEKNNLAHTGATFSVTLPISGEHNVRNALAAIAIAMELGVSEILIQQGLSNPLISEKRLRLVTKNGYSVIDDTYNASPTSVKAALDVLALNQNGRRKMAVLGDMLELGPESPSIHREIGRYAAQIGVHQLYCYGELARDYLTGFQETIKSGGLKGRHFMSKTNLIQELKPTLQPGDIILIKGSRGMKMEEIVAALTDEG